MVSLWGASSLIRSSQRGILNAAAATNATTTTIGSVDPANCVLLVHGYYSDNGASAQSGNLAQWRGQVTAPTTITWTRVGSGFTVSTSWELIEFQPGVLKSLQFVSLDTGAGTGASSTINAVNLDKTMMIDAGSYAQATGMFDSSAYVRIHFASNTSITITRLTAHATSCVGNVYIAEFF